MMNSLSLSCMAMILICGNEVRGMHTHSHPDEPSNYIKIDIQDVWLSFVIWRRFFCVFVESCNLIFLLSSVTRAVNW
jgi:hypothetical protein